ncbi:MAG: LacI family DNA-binding transcriptional regulator, partial [Hamadaea sp.]|nr:LacI family DNA-binding transcriptional regulator [Hamadaea sp.]
MDKRATIKDVAEAAGVGVATVSRVLSGGSASPSTRERVLAVAAQLDYRPSALGRNLRQRRTGGLGLLVPDLTDTFYGQLSEGVLACARSSGEPVVLGSTGGDPEQEAELIGMLLEQSVDRVIAVPSGDAETWAPAIRAGMTVVFADRLPPEAGREDERDEDPAASALDDLMLLDGVPARPRPAQEGVHAAIRPLDVPAVLADDRAGIRTAVRYLRGLGHRRIAFLGGPGHDRRAAAFREAVGSPVDEELVV